MSAPKPTAYAASTGHSNITHTPRHGEGYTDDTSSDGSSDESPLPTPYTATVPTFDVHTPDRRDSVMSSSSDLRAGRSSSDSDRIRITPRRSRRKDKSRTVDAAVLAGAPAGRGQEGAGGLDGGLEVNSAYLQGRGDVPMPSFSRARSSGRTPRAIQVEHAPSTESLNVDVSGQQASYNAGPSTAPAANYRFQKQVPATLTGLPGSPARGLIPGLNITLPSSTISQPLGGSTDILPTPGEEASDVLSSLVPSPRKAFLNQLHSYESRADKARAEGAVPVTPTWGSFDPVKPAYPVPPGHAQHRSGQAPVQQRPPGGTGSMGPPPVPEWAFGAAPAAAVAKARQGAGGSMAAIHKDYLDPDGPSPKSGAPAVFDPAPPVPATLASPVPANGAFSPTPNHGIHSRNLSIHFPRPGQAAHAHRPSEDFGREAPVATAGRGKEAFSGAAGGFAFGATLDQGSGVEGQKAGKRRGHHVSPLQSLYRHVQLTGSTNIRCRIISFHSSTPPRPIPRSTTMPTQLPPAERRLNMVGDKAVQSRARYPTRPSRCPCHYQTRHSPSTPTQAPLHHSPLHLLAAVSHPSRP
jgi:hypothetical protein